MRFRILDDGEANPVRYRFDGCELNTEHFTLQRADELIYLQPQVFEVLYYLLNHRDHIVSKRELMQQLWPNTFITDGAIENMIKLVRRALGDSGRQQRYIQTLRGQGYRFVAQVESEASPQALLSLEETPPPCEPLGEPDGSVQAVTASPLPDERRLVTGLSIGIVDALGLRTRLGLECFHQCLQWLYDLAHPVIQTYGGVLQPVSGDRMMAIFGAQRAYEDHALRAALAATALLERVQNDWPRHTEDSVWRPRLRMGLASEEAIISGLDQRPETMAAVSWDIAHMASALQDQATDDAIVCTGTTARLLRGRMKLEAAKADVLAGQPEPVEHFRVVGAIEACSLLPVQPITPKLPFVGRQHEMAILEERWRHVLTGRGQVVGIVGAPGLGKSRLLAEFRQSLALQAANLDMAYIAGPCLSYGEHTPYLPILQLVRHLLDLQEKSSAEAMASSLRQRLTALGMDVEVGLPALLHFLDGSTPSDLAQTETEILKARLTETLLQLFLRASSQRLLVLEVEDVHWIDKTSESFLTALIERLAGATILLLISYRPGYQNQWMSQSHVTHVVLPPLTQYESEQVVRSILPDLLPDSLTQVILDRADGNPFFLQELSRTIVEHRELDAPPPIPDTVQSVLSARIDRLPQEAKQVLQAASVVQGDLSLPMLEALTECSPVSLQENLHHLQATEFLIASYATPKPAYRFRHILTREVAYHALLSRSRQQYHLRVAMFLREQMAEWVERHPEVLAHHETAAGRSPEAIAAWQAAGRRANARAAYRESIEHLRQGLSLLWQLPDNRERHERELVLQIELGLALMGVEGYHSPEAAAAYQRAYALCQAVSDTDQLLPVLFGLWKVEGIYGSCLRLKQLGKQIAALSVSLSASPLHAMGLAPLACTSFWLGHLAQARDVFEQLLARFGSQELPARADLAESDTYVTSMAHLAWLLWIQGYPEQAMRLSRQALERAEAISHPYTIAFVSFIAARLYQFHREWSAFKACVDITVDIAQQHCFSFLSHTGLLFQGLHLVQTGQPTDGIGHMQTCIDGLRDMGDVRWLPWALAMLGEVLIDQRQCKEGLDLLAQSIEMTERTHERFELAEQLRLQGVGWLAQSTNAKQRQRAETCFLQALEVAREQGAKSFELRTALSLCQLRMDQGQTDETRALLLDIYKQFTEGFHFPDLLAAKALLDELGC